MDNQPNHHNTVWQRVDSCIRIIISSRYTCYCYSPTWDEIGRLAAIASSRTALNYFLERELKHNEGIYPAPPDKK